ncbi:MAG: EAL domain-containing protein [Leptospiraceae bacterium]|nr:EAL domain-containing protein [Leptospiraceae bacterium]
MFEWRSLRGYKAFCIGFLLCLILVINGIVIYLSGGTKFSVTHLLYIPILLSAFFFGFKGTLLTAIFATLIAGPYMPLDVKMSQNQDTFNWILRGVNFLIIGLLSAVILHIQEFQVRALKDHFYSDWITNLPNRFYMEEQFDKFSEIGRKMVLITINANCFLSVTNSFGQNMGEMLLIQLANRIKKTLPENWVLIRMYTDKFAILAPVSANREAFFWIKSNLPILNKNVLIKSIPVYPDISIGVAVSSFMEIDLWSFVLRSSLAMYQAHERNHRMVIYKERKTERITKSVRLLADFSQAIDENQFVLHYQPRISLPDKKVTGFEALIRWNHPEYGFLYPDSFLTVFEKTVLIHQLTQWVLDKALSQWWVWCSKGYFFKIAVNVSPKDFSNPRFLTNLRSMIRKYKVPKNCLEIEITENEFVSMSSRNLNIFKKLSDLGAEISIDDFGSGYSSFAYLRDFPMNVLKIDRMFISSIPTDNKSRSITESIISLGNKLDLTVIGEGVEDIESLEILTKMGCHKAQGYFICKPKDVESIENWLQHSEYCA